MRYLNIEASHAEVFKKKIAENGWQITHQDVGQTELLAYGYMVVWEKDQQKVILNYADRQGIAQANLEVTPNAVTAVESILADL